MCYPDSSCGALPRGSTRSPTIPPMPSWVGCADQSDEVVSQAAKAFRKNGGYSCAKGKQEGACTLAVAAKLCPVTCNLCRMDFACLWPSFCVSDPRYLAARLSAWTWSARSSNGKYCLASQQRCDSATHCGHDLMLLQDCHEAAGSLRLSRSTAVEIDDPLAPRGCFFVEEVKLGTQARTRVPRTLTRIYTHAQ